MDLARQFRRSERYRQTVVLLLMMPSVVFVAICFAWPIMLFLFRSVDNPEVVSSLPRTCLVLRSWDGQVLPPEAAFATLAAELAAVRSTPEAALLARRLNYNITGFRTLVLRTADGLPLKGGEPASRQIQGIDGRWSQTEYWGTIWNECRWLTPFYMLSAVDLRLAADGSIRAVPPETAIFRELFARTFIISFVVALLSLALGFPVAVVMSKAETRTANLLLMLVLIPFWTSLLVRSTAWVILLQNQGLVNQLLIWTGAISQPVQLVYNRIGLYIAMVHVLLPFMILPLFSVLRGIPPEMMRAAASLGASPLYAFLRVYLPLALPGIIAGTSLVFVLSLGYYVTPALVGGPGDQMIGYFIAYFTNSAVNWGMASSLGTILLAVVFVIYLVVVRLAGVRGLRFS